MPTYTQKTKILFLDLPVEVQEEIDKIRRVYNPLGVKRAYAHITFKQDADYTLDTTELLPFITGNCEYLKPFALKLNGLQYAIDDNDDHYHIYLAFKENIHLKKAIAKLSARLEKYMDIKDTEGLTSARWEQSADFFPHITICTGRGAEEGTKIFDQIKSLPIRFQGKLLCDTVSIHEWKKDHWEKLETMTLVD